MGYPHTAKAGQFSSKEITVHPPLKERKLTGGSYAQKAFAIKIGVAYTSLMKQTKSARLHIRLTNAAKKLIEKRAKKYGMSVGHYVTTYILSSEDSPPTNSSE